MFPWAKTFLTEQISQIGTVNEQGFVFTIKADDITVTGTANLVIVRQKPRPGFDLDINATFSVESKS